jgi:hypothetical protein
LVHDKVSKYSFGGFILWRHIIRRRRGVISHLRIALRIRILMLQFEKGIAAISHAHPVIVIVAAIVAVIVAVTHVWVVWLNIHCLIF